MKKNNLLRMTKLTVILFAMVISLTSCQGLIDAVIGTEDKPTSSQQTTPTTTAVVKTESGATFTANTPAEITGLLDQVKSDIAAKGTSEYEVKISNTTVEATSSDYTISVPKVVGSNVNINFDNAVKSSTPLIVKASETASAESTTAVNNLTITMPNVDEDNAIDLELNMPETTITLKTSGTKTVYDYVDATTAINTLYIYPGVVINKLRVRGGTVVVKKGGSIDTYVYPIGKIGTSEDSKIIASYSHDLSTCGIEPFLLNYYGRERYEISTDEEGLNPYYIKNLKVVKGAGEYAHIVFNSTASMIHDEDGILVDIGDNYPIETLTIDDGASVLLSSYPQIKNIIGEGKQTARIMSDLYLDKPESPESNSENYFYFYYVQKMSNVVVDTYSPKGFVPSMSNANYIPLQIENCTFKNFRSIRLRGLKDGENYVKNCNFSNMGSSRITLELDGKYLNKIYFENCDFKNDQEFSVRINNEEIKLDENGNRVYNYRYNWWETSYSGNHVPKTSQDMGDIPAEIYAVGETDGAYVNDEYSKGYWVTKSLAYEEYDISNKKLTIEFKDCTLPNPIGLIWNSRSHYDITDFIINGKVVKVTIKVESGISYPVVEWK